jgi:ubiquinol-cytochrome c reductase cytochrome b subunit
MIRALIAFLDERLHSAPFIRKLLRKAFPDHWSFMLGEIALYSLIILIVTGIWLTSQFDASNTIEVYYGPLTQLNGHWFSSAYSSTMRLSTVVPLGLLVRQTHHWASLFFLVSIILHMARVFFTGAFRKPRDFNWQIGIGLLILALLQGFTGASLADDLYSGTRLRVIYSIMQSIPLMGSWLAFHVFGGMYPSGFMVGHLFISHVLLIPAILLGVTIAHIAVVMRQKHAQFPGPGRSADTVVGPPLWPNHLFKSVGFGAGIFGILVLLGSHTLVNPVWQYGAYHAWTPTVFLQPDWYLGWLDGALRLGPGWEMRLGSFVIPSLFFIGVGLPVILFGLLLACPILDRHFTKDTGGHEMLDMPYDTPVRAGVGTAFMIFVMILFLVDSDDAQAAALHIDVEVLLETYRALAVIAPLALGAIVYWICRKARPHPRTRD